MNLTVPQKVRNFFVSWGTVSFSRKTLIHGAYMASCPGLQFDWSTAELCTLVVPHILSAACTTVTRLHGVPSQNSADLNQQTTWRSAVQPDTFHNFAVLFPVLPTYRQLTVKLVYFKELPHIFQDHVSNCFVLLLHHKCSIKTHLDTCQYYMMNITSVSSTARINAILHANCTTEPIPVALRSEA